MHKSNRHHPPYDLLNPPCGHAGVEPPVKRDLHPLPLDLAAVGLVIVVGYLAALWLNLFDGVVNWLYANKQLEVEELLGAIFILPLALAIVAFRRCLALRRALKARQKAEARLAETARLEGVLLAAG